MSNLLFEIFSEEIPATLQSDIVVSYKSFIIQTFKKFDFVAEGDLFVWITQNRFVVFAKKCNLDEIKTKDFVLYVLKEFSKTFPRTMCYPQMEIRWIRPIRSIFVCIDGNVVEGDFFGIHAKNGTYLDKFNFVSCKNVDEYLAFLHKNEIIIDYFQRLEFVKCEIYNKHKEITSDFGKEIDDFETYWKGEGKIRYLKLAKEIAGMSEYCIKPMQCILDKEFYILPFELIELVLRENQRYVVLPKDNNGDIKFLVFGDKITANSDKRQEIIKGHQKVVKARLEDALYYWRLDGAKKDQLKEGYRQHLHDVLSAKIFIDDLAWGEYLQKQVDFAKKMVINKDTFEKVKKLIVETKLDLSTNVVVEFPELQGIIGGYYFGYNFNPYELKKVEVEMGDEVLYFYLIDRLVYIFTMYEHGKQPTGSGDKYKIKKRMDDVVEIFDNRKDLFDVSAIFTNEEVKNLFVKRYVKYIEDLNKDFLNIKKIAEKYVEYVFEKGTIGIQQILAAISNDVFMKTYRRIAGYTTEDTRDEEKDKNKIGDKIKEIFENEDLNNLNRYLDNHKIADDNDVVSALKTIKKTYFESRLPKCFLEIN